MWSLAKDSENETAASLMMTPRLDGIECELRESPLVCGHRIYVMRDGNDDRGYDNALHRGNTFVLLFSLLSFQVSSFGWLS